MISGIMISLEDVSFSFSIDTSIGFQFGSLFEIHASYRTITSKNIEKLFTSKKYDFSGNVLGIGVTVEI